MVTTKVKLGNSMVEFSAPTQTATDDVKAACKIGALVGDFPSECGICGSKDIHLYHKSPKGNDYYGLKCSNKDCGAEFNFHQQKENKGFYIRYDDVWERYVPNEHPSPQPSPQEQRLPDSFDDDVPY